MADRRDASELRGKLVLAGLLAIVLALPLVGLLRGDGEPESVSVESRDGRSPAQHDVDQATVSEIATLVESVLAGEVPPPPESSRLSEVLGPTFVALREDGDRVASAWNDEGESVHESIVAALEEARDDLEGTNDVDAVDVCLTHGYEDVPDLDAGTLDNVHVGVLGVEMRVGDATARYSPTLMLENNWNAQDAAEILARELSVTVDELANHLALSVFDCDQVYIGLEPELEGRLMFRGNEIVDPAAVDQDRVQEAAELMGGWLERAVQSDGRMVYKYWPSARRESDANNMIRQWMATVALGRWADFKGGDQAVYDLAARNIEYNLENFYEERGELGTIRYDDEVKLGAVALAALAIHEHPDAQRWAEAEEALHRTMIQLWNEDGSFDTFLYPEERRRDNQNFYPGEALVYWAERYADDPDPELLDRIMRSFRYYRDWHLDEDNRNPAFVPWHTQAYVRLWEQTRDAELADFVFEMNDWLLPIQQWEDVLYPDLQGRFYDPDRPGFGVPHASSTGVYLEGLAAAHRLAEQVDDQARADSYRTALQRGLRSSLQLQFADDLDMYYVTEPDRVRGGLRTTVYDNEIRVDNVQHTLMGAMEILEAGVLPG